MAAPPAAGDLASVDYSDATPDVSYQYDRQGRRTSAILNSQFSILNSYNNAGQPLTESWTGGPLDGVTLTRAYDNLLRLSNLSAATSAFSLPPSAFSYDSASRLSSVSSTANGSPLTAHYSYLANSSLVSDIAFKKNGAPVMTTAKQYDGLNRLTQISSLRNSDSSLLASHSYQYNAANQRTKNTLADGSYWEYTYDALGQVVAGKKFLAGGAAVPGQDFGYEFDSIGNRTTATANGRQAVYTVNALNQYTQRTVPGAMDIMGAAKPDATVTINNKPVTRVGDYFHVALTLDNSAAAVYQDVKAVGVKGNIGPAGEDAVTEQMGKVFLPQTPEPFTFDADGNLATNGRFMHTWNGENRLTMVSALPALPDGAKRKAEYTYDYQARMIQRKVYNWNAGTAAYELAATIRFVYDGWHLTAELDGNGNLLRSYTWGTDLSGSMGGAGGVGGLQMMHDVASNADYFFCYDGNGNVTALVNAATGELAAQYDYDAFGNLLKSTGPMANVNRFRFSTKYQDDITGYLYYGYRWYDPSTGRWCSRDSLEEQGGNNLYGFVSNCPTWLIDPYGLQSLGSYWSEFLNGESYVRGIEWVQIAKSYVTGTSWLLPGSSNPARMRKWLMHAFMTEGIFGIPSELVHVCLIKTSASTIPDSAGTIASVVGSVSGVVEAAFKFDSFLGEVFRQTVGQAIAANSPPETANALHERILSPCDGAKKRLAIYKLARDLVEKQANKHAGFLKDVLAVKNSEHDKIKISNWKDHTEDVDFLIGGVQSVQTKRAQDFLDFLEKHEKYWAGGLKEMDGMIQDESQWINRHCGK